MLTAIVLAAGSSRRMGRNKLLLPFKGKPLLAYVVQQILSAKAGSVVVVTGHEASLVEASLKGLSVQIVQNSRYEEGMTSSIQAGVAAADGEGYMICLSDMVLITSEEYASLQQAFKEHYLSDDRCIIQPDYKGEKGNPVIFSAAHRSAILQHPEKEGCKQILRSNAAHIVAVRMLTDHVLRDIDYPDEYQSLPPHTS